MHKLLSPSLLSVCWLTLLLATPATALPTTGTPPLPKQQVPPTERAAPAAQKNTAPAEPAPPAGNPAIPAPAPQPGAESPPAPDTDTPQSAAEAEDAEAAAGTLAARPVGTEPVQVFGWREWATIGDSGERLIAKLDTGALTSSVHAEDVEPFERDGQKWVRFIITDPTRKDAKRVRITAPLVRTAKIKNPGGGSESRLVVRLNFQIGTSKLRSEFTLNNRTNMISPVLVGRSALKELGLIDPGRTYLAEEKIIR